MAKPVQQVMTRGVEGLCLPPHILGAMFSKAMELLRQSTFISFIPKENQVEVTDGNKKRLATLNISLPKRVWIIFDDYGDRWVGTALLPEEY